MDGLILFSSFMAAVLALLFGVSFLESWWNRRKQAKAPPVKKQEQWPDFLPPKDLLAQQIAQKARLRCSLAMAEPGKLPQDPRATVLGNVLVRAPDEKWPHCEGEPMVGIAQFNLNEIPNKPDSLSDIDFVAVFMARGDPEEPHEIPLPPEEHRDQWLIRAYKNAAELTPYTDAPPVPKELKPCGVRWEELDDYPGHWEEVYELREKHGLSYDWAYELDEELQDLDRGDDKLWGTKVGGWPAPIQDPKVRPLALQIGCENDVGLQWVDGGCVYIWRKGNGFPPDWEMDIEFY